MAIRTSVGSGLWSAAGTWDTGVPADNDGVVIAAGHTVEFNVDQSGFANGIDGLTISATATLKLTRTAGTYCLKIKAAKTIIVTGTFDCGTALDVIPFIAKHRITGGSGWYVNGTSGGIMTVYGIEPSIKYVRLSGAEDAGQTVLEVDTDVTGDIWQPGDTIHVVNINRGQNLESRTIAAGGISSGAITITAGLTGAKVIGAYVVLMSRHLTFDSPAGGGQTIRNFTTAGKLIISGGYFFNPIQDSIVYIYNGAFLPNNNSVLVNSNCSNSIVYGGVFSGASNFATGSQTNIVVLGGSFFGLYGLTGGGSTRFKFSNILVGGGQYPFNAAHFSTVQNSVIRGCLNAIMWTSYFVAINTTFEINNVGAYDSTGIAINCTFSANNNSAMNGSNFELTDCLINDSEFSVVSGTLDTYGTSKNHDQITDNFAAWSWGAITTRELSIYPSGFTHSARLQLTSAIKEGYFKRKILVPAGKKVAITSWLRKSASMAYLPRVWIFEDGYEPFYDATKIIDEFIMTDSIDTWESHSYEYTNSASYDKMIQVRTVGKNASGYVYTQIAASFGGGLSRSRVLGGV